MWLNVWLSAVDVDIHWLRPMWTTCWTLHDDLSLQLISFDHIFEICLWFSNTEPTNELCFALRIRLWLHINKTSLQASRVAHLSLAARWKVLRWRRTHDVIFTETGRPSPDCQFLLRLVWFACAAHHFQLYGVGCLPVLHDHRRGKLVAAARGYYELKECTLGARETRSWGICAGSPWYDGVSNILTGCLKDCWTLGFVHVASQ